ncbi:transporter, putative [Plasmodium reichenowi]|uniref:Transporter, putative n=1 Tax=Plasmodium reichenowi TaxID=5854 RepID=A0A060RUX7_PLARE|nr:transporter, putative [Plasmodium reichenowi]
MRNYGLLHFLLVLLFLNLSIKSEILNRNDHIKYNSSVMYIRRKKKTIENGTFLLNKKIRNLRNYANVYKIYNKSEKRRKLKNLISPLKRFNRVFSFLRSHVCNKIYEVNKKNKKGYDIFYKKGRLNVVGIWKKGKRNFFNRWLHLYRRNIGVLSNIKKKYTYYLDRIKNYIEEDNMLNFFYICKNVLWKKSIFFLTIFVMINSAIISIIIPRYDNIIFSELSNRKFDRFGYLLCNCILIRVLNIFFCGLRNYIFMITSSYCLKCVKSLLFRIYLNKDYEYYDKVDHTVIINKLTLEAHNFSDIIPYYINPLIRNFFSIILNFSYIFYLNKKLSLVILYCFMISSLLSMISSKLKKSRLKKINREKIQNTKISLEALNNMNIIKLYSTELHECNKFFSSLNNILNLEKKKEQFNLLHMIINKFFVMMTYILILLKGNVLLKNKEIDKHIFTSFFFYINNIYSYIDILDYYIDICDIVSQYNDLIKMLKNYHISSRLRNINEYIYENMNIEENEKIDKEINMEQNINDVIYNGTNKLHKNIVTSGERTSNFSNGSTNDKIDSICNTQPCNKEKNNLILNYNILNNNMKNILYFNSNINKRDDNLVLHFDNVYFKYDCNPHNYVLKNINMKIYKNTNNVIIGKSGGGKSTILKLILNMYKCTRGTIYLYNKLINNYTRHDIFNKITYVEQDSKLLNASIKDNLTYGIINNDFDMLDLVNISKCSTSHDFICRLRKRYETLISHKTELLTSSQKQKICITRALTRYPKILLLDESTSAIDKDNERNIFENIRKNSMFKDLSIIRITHKKANLDIADNVFLLKDGYLTRQKKFRISNK